MLYTVKRSGKRLPQLAKFHRKRRRMSEFVQMAHKIAQDDLARQEMAELRRAAAR
jgi:hypothetical protein